MGAGMGLAVSSERCDATAAFLPRAPEHVRHQDGSVGCPLLLACFIISKPPRQNSGQKHTAGHGIGFQKWALGMQDRALLGLAEAIRICCRRRRGRRRDGGPGVRAASLLLCSAGGGVPKLRVCLVSASPVPRACVHLLRLHRAAYARSGPRQTRHDAGSIRRSRREHAMP